MHNLIQLILHSPGYYCPNGTVAPDQYACPDGSYSNRTDLYSADQCLSCPPGWYCVSGTGGYSSAYGPQPCRWGHYCPEQTSNAERYPCPQGTYSNQSNLYAASQCDVCPAGSYCEGMCPFIDLVSIRSLRQVFIH